MLRLLQICNVGQIVGGTAACAWTVTRSLPGWEHVVAFPKLITDETREQFSHCRTIVCGEVTPALVESVDPDVVLLHNIAAGRAPHKLPALTVQYVHSRIEPAEADLTVYCSRWLAAQYGARFEDVLHQAVPRPIQPDRAVRRALRGEPIIGRICTPQVKKWPRDLVEFYRKLDGRFPSVQWEFVGCPQKLADELSNACNGRARFHAASWEARSRLWEWDALLYHHPTLTESFGRVVAEALRAGCVPIVDDRGGFQEIVTSDCGYLCGDVDAFTAAVEVVHDPGRRMNLSRACRVRGDEFFSLERFGRELVARIRQAAGSAEQNARLADGQSPHSLH